MSIVPIAVPAPFTMQTDAAVQRDVVRPTAPPALHADLPETGHAFRADPAGGTARCRQRPACRRGNRSPCLVITSGLIDQRRRAQGKMAAAHKDFGELLHQFTFQTHLNASPPLIRHRAGQRIERDFMDQMRGFLRDFFFDPYAAFFFGRRHKDHATRTTVKSPRRGTVLADVGRRFNQNLVYRWPLASV